MSVLLLGAVGAPGALAPVWVLEQGSCACGLDWPVGAEAGHCGSGAVYPTPGRAIIPLPPLNP